MSWVRTPLAAPKIPPHPVDLFRAGYALAHQEACLPRAPQHLAAAPVLPPAPRNLFAGTSGWAYPTWKPGFYPAEVPARNFLEHYSSRLNSVEVNYTFRKLPTAKQLNDWLAATPAGFRFSFKAPQRITHFQRLRDSHNTVAEFVDALAPVRAAGKLGPLLFQLPPNFKADNDRLAAFFEMPALADKSLQLTFEFRNAGWFTDSTYKILKRHNAALCVAESEDLATPDVRTAKFCCYRLRCDGGYTETKLKSFAEKFTRLATKHPTFVYFKHEDEPTGALNATSLLRRAVALTKPAAPSRSRSR